MRSEPAFLPARQRDAGNHGSVMLVVLALLGLITVLALSVGRLVSSSGLEIAAGLRSGSDNDLRAAIELGAAAIRKLGDNMRSAEAFAEINGKRISVHITNERARIDLNTSSAEVLAALFVGAGTDKSEADALAKGLVDRRWRPAAKMPTSSTSTNDPFNQNLSSTSPDFENLGNAASQYFVHPSQLASLPGFSKQLVAAILPHVTVANGSNQIDPFIARAEVLAALPGVDASNIEAFQEARDNSGRDIALKLLSANRVNVTDTAASGWRLEIAIREPKGRVRTSEAVIAVFKGDEVPFRVVYIDEG